MKQKYVSRPIFVAVTKLQNGSVVMVLKKNNYATIDGKRLVNITFRAMRRREIIELTTESEYSNFYELTKEWRNVCFSRSGEYNKKGVAVFKDNLKEILENELKKHENKLEGHKQRVQYHNEQIKVHEAKIRSIETFIKEYFDDFSPPHMGDKNSSAVELGRLGGLKGGKARAAKLSPEKRSEIAKKAAETRWKKQK